MPISILSFLKHRKNEMKNVRKSDTCAREYMAAFGFRNITSKLTLQLCLEDSPQFQQFLCEMETQLYLFYPETGGCP